MIGAWGLGVRVAVDGPWVGVGVSWGALEAGVGVGVSPGLVGSGELTGLCEVGVAEEPQAASKSRATTDRRATPPRFSLGTLAIMIVS